MSPNVGVFVVCLKYFMLEMFIGILCLSRRMSSRCLQSYPLFILYVYVDMSIRISIFTSIRACLPTVTSVNFVYAESPQHTFGGVCVCGSVDALVILCSDSFYTSFLPDFVATDVDRGIFWMLTSGDSA